MLANARQIGGDHYKGSEYQHWDWVHECRLHYLSGVASKYISRHRRKNGTEDLEKALHYIDKAEECHVTESIQTNRMQAFWRFALENRLTIVEAMICWYIMEGEWEPARLATQTLLAQTIGE